jgi:hypothetical protein
MFREVIAVYCENYTKHKYALCAKSRVLDGMKKTAALVPKTVEGHEQNTLLGTLLYRNLRN